MGQMLDRTIQVVEELREVLTEGRALLKDLRHENKEARRLKQEVETLIVETLNDNMADAIDEAIKNNADRFNADVKAMHQQAERNILDAFEKLTNTLLYGNTQGRGSNVLEEIMREKGLIR